MISSRLHPFLRGGLNLPLGLFSRLELSAKGMDPRQHRHLSLALRRFAPAGGFRPDERGGLFAVGWVLAGSVIADMPASANRNHFHNPADKAGLDNSEHGMLGWVTGLMATLEGGDTVRQFLTGTGFDLTGQSALSWARSPHNPQSLDAFVTHLVESVAAPEPAQRSHRLALSLVALGGLLHLLQDMASPTHTRNDFAVGHMQRMGTGFLNRGAAFERYVARRYGRHGLPTYSGKPVKKQQFTHFFSSPKWDGLADISHLGHFSPGTLPRPHVVGSHTDAKELHRRLVEELTWQKPALDQPDLSCAARRTCYLRSADGRPLTAYRVDAKNRLRFFLTNRCHRSAARRMLPLAVGYSIGLVDHLLRASLTLDRSSGGVLVTLNGAAIASGQLRLLVEDKDGKRTLLKTVQLSAAAEDATLATVKLPSSAGAVWAVLDAKDTAGEPLVAIGQAATEVAQD